MQDIKRDREANNRLLEYIRKSECGTIREKHRNMNLTRCKIDDQFKIDA